MPIAISNIAWPLEADDELAELLVRHGVTGIEVAPTKVWPTPTAALPSEIRSYKKKWESKGVRIVAAQSLLYGRADLTVFEDESKRKETVDYLSQVIALCAELGAENLVFGSPKNRRVGSLDRYEAEGIAVEFFRTLATVAHRLGTTMVIEANPPAYGADYITTALDAVELVSKVDHPGFGLHLDSACLTMAADPIGEVFLAASKMLRHFHISEPFLVPFGEGQVQHKVFSAALHEIGYSHWVSVEMRQSEPFSLESIEHVLINVKALYSDFV